LDNFGELLSGAALGLWRAASSGAASGTNFGEQISGTALGSSFVNSFLGQRWGAAMRGPAFYDACWEHLSGRNFGKPLWELAFVGSIW